MPSIRDLECQVRDLVNAPRKFQSLIGDRQKWNRVCSAMDVIGDTELAIDAYLGGAPEHADHGALYLGVYGILQVLVAQQDALSTLATELGVPFKLPTELAEIRQVRIASIGHPTDIRSGKDRHVAFISRATLSWGGFELWVASDAGDERKYVQIKVLVEDQRRLVVDLLQRITDHLISEERDHRKQHRENPLEAAFDPQLLYALEKLREGIRDSAVASLAEWGLGVVSTSIEKFKNRLAERVVDEGYAGVPAAIEAAEQPLRRLEAYFAGETRLEKEDALVYSHYLQTRVDELQHLAREIDKEYASDNV